MKAAMPDIYWGGSTNELSDTLFYDTVIDGYANMIMLPCGGGV